MNEVALKSDIVLENVTLFWESSKDSFGGTQHGDGKSVRFSLIWRFGRSNSTERNLLGLMFHVWMNERLITKRKPIDSQAILPDWLLPEEIFRKRIILRRHTHTSTHTEQVKKKTNAHSPTKTSACDGRQKVSKLF